MDLENEKLLKELCHASFDILRRVFRPSHQLHFESLYGFYVIKFHDIILSTSIDKNRRNGMWKIMFSPLENNPIHKRNWKNLQFEIMYEILFYRNQELFPVNFSFMQKKNPLQHIILFQWEKGQNEAFE